MVKDEDLLESWDVVGTCINPDRSTSVDIGGSEKNAELKQLQKWLKRVTQNNELAISLPSTEERTVRHQ